MKSPATAWTSRLQARDSNQRFRQGRGLIGISARGPIVGGPFGALDPRALQQSQCGKDGGRQQDQQTFQVVARRAMCAFMP